MPFDEFAPPEWIAGYQAHGTCAHFDNPHNAALEPDKFSRWRDGFREAEDDWDEDYGLDEDDDDE